MKFLGFGAENNTVSRVARMLDKRRRHQHMRYNVRFWGTLVTRGRVCLRHRDQRCRRLKGGAWPLGGVSGLSFRKSSGRLNVRFGPEVV